MNTTTFTHACPVIVQGEPCEADVLVTYEVGRGRDEFFSVVDEEVCAMGHVMDEVVVVTWYEEDAVAYGERLHEQYEAADYYNQSGGL